MTHRPIAEGSIPPGLAAPAPGACRWLISLDYDGTLQNPAGPPIVPEFFEQMEAWRPYGVRWGINTGRALDYLLEEILPCSPSLPDFICTCERYVYMADECRLLQPATAHNDECHMRNLALREQLAPHLHRLLAALRNTHPHLQWELAAADPLSVEAADSATMDAIIPHIQCLESKDCTIQRAGRYMRFADSRHTKGTALAYIMQVWNIPPERVFIMGDGHNDLDAFRQFPTAWCAAPCTAHTEVLEWLSRHPGTHSAPEPDVLPELRRWFQKRVNPGNTEKMCP